MSLRPRNGFSLLEVLLATALLFGCVVVLVELASIGREHAQSADALAVAQLACYSKMNALLCGAEPLETVEEEPMDNLPGWLLSVELEEAEQAGIRVLRVTVAEEVEPAGGLGTLPGGGASTNTYGNEEEKGRSFSLTRWIYDLKSAAGSDGGFMTEPDRGEPAEPGPAAEASGGPDEEP